MTENINKGSTEAGLPWMDLTPMRTTPIDPAGRKVEANAVRGTTTDEYPDEARMPTRMVSLGVVRRAIQPFGSVKQS